MATAVRRQIKWSAVALLSALTIAFAAAAISSAQTSDADEGRVLVDDCFGQLFADDPLHCQIFAELHNVGTLTVGQIYLANDFLYIFITEPESELDAIFETIATKVLEAYAIAPDPDWHCREFAGCRPGSLINPRSRRILPYSVQYTDIALRAGGAAALRFEPGWASFEQVWPVPVGGDYARSASRSQTTAPPSSVDVSDVDTVNIPEIECGMSTWIVDGPSELGCHYWNKYPDLGIADWRSTPWNTYIDVKASANRPTGEWAAARRFLAENHFASPDDARFIVFNAVSYDYADQYRWAMILNRFVYSRGNATGIVSAYRFVNTAGASGDRPIHFPLPDLQPVADYWDDRADVRSTLAVETRLFDETIEALPQILEALGIPVEAVGLVIESHPIPPRGSGMEHVGESYPEPLADEYETQPVPMKVPLHSGFPASFEDSSESDADGLLPEFSALQPWWIAPIVSLAALAAIGFYVRTIRRRKSRR